MTAAYAVSGPTRGGFLMLLACSMVFGAFAPKRTHTRNACALTLALLAAVMFFKSRIDPLCYPARIEAIHFLLFTVTLTTIAAVAGQMSNLRTRLTARNDELADALKRIHVLATCDELTGLANRRQMRECLDAEVIRIQRSQSAACLCLIELDFFKLVNDRHGHAAGDLVLKEFARVAAGVVRQSDVIARWGGEEFLWLLPDTSVADASTAIERLRRAFAAAAAWARRPELQTTFSTGLAQLHPHEGVDQALERTDLVSAVPRQVARARQDCIQPCRVASHSSRDSASVKAVPARPQGLIQPRRRLPTGLPLLEPA
jgi:diguanylate cyclase (GGDEF)-like protein